VVTKERVLAEIRRTAATNGDVPLGKERFLAATGIRESAWKGIHWVNWADAVREAGYAPNEMQSAYDATFLLDSFVKLIQELGHFPVNAEVRMKNRRDPDFPNAKVFSRLGLEAQLAARVLEHAKALGLSDVVALCAPIALPPNHDTSDDDGTADVPLGFVYLIRFGRHFKIGRSNSTGRRQRELAIQLPEKTSLVHSITTDDPIGIEDYWHRRFADKRGNGEWFSLTRQDISAFRRRKFM
jgi:hypothetical protein